MFSRKWLLTTILVVAAMAVMIRLGIWQLDRLEQRRAFNARVGMQLAEPELGLAAGAIPDDLDQMEYRSVQVVGEYLPEGELALRNQYWNDQWGVHLVTPLKIAGSDQVILVDRGWIPGEAYQSGDWAPYAEPGVVTVRGVIRRSQEKAELGSRADPTPAPGEQPRESWNFINIPQIAAQTPASLLPVYIQQAPEPGREGLPTRSEPELELTEGPHMGYAIQWFIFAAILGIGYPFYIQRQAKRQRDEKTQVQGE